MKRIVLFPVPALLFCAFGLTACPDKTQQTNVYTTISAVEVSLTSAERVAKIYTDLPRCGSVKATTSVCSDPTTVEKIGSLDNTAYTAVKMAEKDSTMLTVAQQAISALVAAVPSTPTPKAPTPLVQ